MAEAHYIPVAPHNACSPVGTMASIHLAISTPNLKIQETFDDVVEPWVREAIIGRPEINNVTWITLSVQTSTFKKKPRAGTTIPSASLSGLSNLYGCASTW